MVEMKLPLDADLRMFCFHPRLEPLLLKNPFSSVEVGIPDDRSQYDYKWQGIPVKLRRSFEEPYYINCVGHIEYL